MVALLINIQVPVYYQLHIKEIDNLSLKIDNLSQILIRTDRSIDTTASPDPALKLYLSGLRQ